MPGSAKLPGAERRLDLYYGQLRKVWLESSGVFLVGFVMLSQFVLIGLLFLVYFFIPKKKGRGKRGLSFGVPDFSFLKRRAVKPNLAVYVARPVLSDPEQSLYWRLYDVLPSDKFVLLSQVSFAAFISARGGSQFDRDSKFNSARQKYADFVVCSLDFQVLAVIELDDRSHDLERDKARDAILNEAGIAVVRWNVKNLPTTQEIREALL